jgi:hypothetical protein
MRIAARLLASVLLLTLSMPVALINADTGDAIAISGLSGTETAGTSDSFTVTGLTSGIEDPTYTGTVTFTSSDPSAVLPPPYMFDGSEGHHVFSVTFQTAGVQSVTATDDSSLTDSANTTVGAGNAFLVVANSSLADLASGGNRNISATVTDAFGNPVIGDSVAFTQSGTGSVSGLASDTTNSSGVASVTATGNIAGTVVIKAADGSIHDSVTFDVVAGPLDHINVTPSLATVSPGQSQSYTTTAFDNANNTIGDETGSAVLTITPNGSCTTTSCSAAVGGTHTIHAAFSGKTDTATLDVGNNSPVANPDSKTVLENAASTAIAVLANDTDADNDTLTVTSVTNPPHGTASVDGDSGGVHYTPDVNYNGSDSFSYDISDGNGGVDTGLVSITVSAVNQVPSFTGGGNDTTLEDSGGQTISHWATSISKGASNESGQLLNFIVTDNNNPLFSVQPQVDAGSGDLTYTPAANANGTALVTVKLHDNGGVASGGVDTSATQTMTITVTSVNDAPTFTAGADQAVLENSAARTVAGWATLLSPGPANESGQVLSINTTNDNNGLFSAQPSVSLTGTLTFTPAANANGSAIVSVTLSDNGGTASGGDDSTTKTFTISVSPVNQVPSFVGGADDTTLEDSGAQSITNWATSINKGAPNEAGQSLNFIVTNTNNALFSTQPDVNASTGSLTYTPAANANGVATVTVKLHDDGGTLGGGVDTSAPQTMTITVTAVNDTPTFTDPADQTINEDAGAQIAAGLSAPVTAGPSNESGQVLTFLVTNDNNALFSAQPTLNTATGTLTYTPAANANGSAVVTAVLSDNGGTANGGDDSLTHTFTITVRSVNDAPSFVKGADQTLAEQSSPSTQTVVGWATGFSPGPSQESGQTVLAYNILTDDHPLLFSVQPAISTNGTLTYKLAANRNGVANISLNVQDSGGTANGGVDISPTQTFKITVTGVDHPPAATNDLPVIIEGSGPTTIDVLANDNDPDGDNLTIAGIRQGARGHVAMAANRKSLTYDPTGTFVGTDSFIYSVSDGRGGLAVATVFVTIAKDTIAPIATAPVAWITTRAVGTTASIVVTFSGTDQGLGIKNFQLSESRNNGPWVATPVVVGAHSIVRIVTIGSLYQYRVRAVDLAGNIGPWANLANFTPTLFQESSGTYTQTWTGSHPAYALGKRLVFNRTPRGNASFTCTCSSISVISPKGPGQGGGRVYIDGTFVATVSEFNSKTLGPLVLFAHTWTTKGSHRIDIVNTGVQFDVDAFLTLQ